MQRGKVWIGVITIFLLGAVAGALATGYVQRREVQNLLAGDRPPQVRVVARILEGLSLTDAQRREIRAIVDASRPEMTAVLNTYRPEMETVFKNTISRIRAVLDSGQKKAFDAGLARMAERLRRFHEREREGHRRFPRFQEPPPEPDDVLAALNPKPDRREAVRAILETADAQRRAVRERFHHRHQALSRKMRRRLDAIDAATLDRLRPLLSDAELKQYQRLTGPPSKGKNRPPLFPAPPPDDP